MAGKKSPKPKHLFGREPLESVLDIREGDDLMDGHGQIWEVAEVLTLADEALLKRKFGKKKSRWVRGREFQDYWKVESGD